VKITRNNLLGSTFFNILASYYWPLNAALGLEVFMLHRIRRAVIDDVDQIAKIHVDSWAEAYKGLMPINYIESFTVERRTKLWTNIISRDLAFVMVAEDNSGVIGFLCFGQPKGYENTNNYELSSLYIAPSRYGCGVGSSLYKECKKELSLKKAQQVKLWVLDSNQRAINFYKKHNFTPTGNSDEETVGKVVLIDLELSSKLST